METLSAAFWLSVVVVGALVALRALSVYKAGLDVRRAATDAQLERTIHMRALASMGGSTPKNGPRRRSPQFHEQEGGDDEEEPEEELTFPPAIMGLIRGSGLDLDALKAGDLTEWRRGLELLKNVKLEGGAPAQGSNGFASQLQPGETYV